MAPKRKPETLEEDGFVYKKMSKASTAKTPATPALLPTPEQASARLQPVIAALCHTELQRVQDIAKSVPSADTRLVAAAASAYCTALQERLAHIHQPDNDTEPDLYTMPEDAAGRVEVLKTMLSKFQAEEEEWKQVAARQADFESRAASQKSQLAALIENASRDASDHVTKNAASGQLTASFVSTHRKLVFQVDALVAMLEGVEDMVQRAERACLTMQKEFHQEKFKPFAHVDSPFTLIRNLARGGGGGGGQA